jgi:chemotaxis protein methyltransferase CheR
VRDGDVRREVVGELSSPNPLARWRAASALGLAGSPEADALLVGVLGDGDYRIREAAVSALARRLGPRMAEACAASLRDARSTLARASAAEVLARGGDIGRARLLELISGEAPAVRRAAARVLPGSDADPPTVMALEAAMRMETDTGVRAELVAALGRTKRPEAVSCLLAEAEGPSLWLAVHAVVALGELGVPAIGARLLALLREPELRDAVLCALAKLPGAAVAEELARRAAAGESDARLLDALSVAVESAPQESVKRLSRLWPAAPGALRPRLPDGSGSPAERRRAAILMARLDVADAAAAIVDAGGAASGFDALRFLPAERYPDAVGAALRTTDPEAALSVLAIPARPSARASLAILLSHPSPAVRTGTLGRLPLGAAPLSDLVSLLAEGRHDTSLAAAFMLAAEAGGSGPERARACRSALVDRAGGPDGAGRAAALRALARVEDPGVRPSVVAALHAADPSVREAAAAAAGFVRGIGEEELRACLRDEEAAVRAAALRSLTRRAERRPESVSLERRDLLPLLAEDPVVASAAAAALVAVAGPSRPRLVRELLAQRGPVRRAAAEEIPATRDAQAAEAVAPAATHEDAETARLVLRAMAVARPEVAERALAEGLRDRRAEVRIAAAAAIVERPSPASGDGDLAQTLAEALAHETDRAALEALLAAVPVAGGRSCLEPLVRRLGASEPSRTADAAIEALAQRFPEDARIAWASAPPRSAGRLSRALAVASGARPASGKPPGLPDGVFRLFTGMVNRRTGLALPPSAKSRLELLLWAEARAAGSFLRLFAVLRESAAESALFGRLLDAVARPGEGFFSNEPALRALAGEILPERRLSKGPDGSLDVWWVGCGSGEGPYSLAMLLAEEGSGGGEVAIRASEFSPGAVRHAEAAIFFRHALVDVDAARRVRHFEAAADGGFRVRDTARSRVRFSARSLFDEPPGGARYDAIVCPALLPLLDPVVRLRALETLAALLKPGGYLLLGEGDGPTAAGTSLTLVRLGAVLAWRR